MFYCCVCVRVLGRVWLFVTPWTVAGQPPLSMAFSRKEYWSGFTISYSRGSSQPRDRTKVSCISSEASDFFTTEPPGKSGKPLYYSISLKLAVLIWDIDEREVERWLTRWESSRSTWLKEPPETLGLTKLNHQGRDLEMCIFSNHTSWLLQIS